MPDIFAGTYEEACKALDLEPASGGYALYLLDLLPGRLTVVSTDTGPVRAARNALAAGSDGRMDTGPPTPDRLVDVRAGWPEEFGGGPRCQFCRDPHPSWRYDSADVDVLLGNTTFEWEPELPVLGTELMGRIDWDACGACHQLIEADDWFGLVRRYGELGAPMPVQAAWRQFWAHRGPALRAAPPPRTPVRRRLAADEILTNWDAFTAQPDRPAAAHSVLTEAAAMAALDAARAYVDRPPPPPGKVRSYVRADQARFLRADGDGWSLVARADAAAFLLVDTTPDIIYKVGRGPNLPSLLTGLDTVADRR